LGAPAPTGDPFAFDLVAAQLFGATHLFLSTADPAGPVIGPDNDLWVVFYQLSWTETAGVLTSVGINFDTQQDSLHGFGLNGGEVASDFEIAGCKLQPCQISGSWVDSPSAVAEPGMLGVMLVGFAWLVGRRSFPGKRSPRGFPLPLE
jgi:hypothetical protein